VRQGIDDKPQIVGEAFVYKGLSLLLLGERSDLLIPERPTKYDVPQGISFAISLSTFSSASCTI
jgi:hypothetical protein